MRKTLQCDECRALITLPATVKTVSCSRCGETYLVNDGNPPRRLYPALHMYPVTVEGVESIWMPTQTRPIRHGLYECRFRTTEPHVLRLHWNGRRFLASTGEPVAMGEFLTWRGVLAP